MCNNNTPLTETNNFIVLKEYIKKVNTDLTHQSEAQLEAKFINDLKLQGYQIATHIKNNTDLLNNARIQLQNLNNITFTNTEWERFLKEYLNQPNDTLKEAATKIHNNYIYDFTFDNGKLTNIYLLDKKNILRNNLQVISQFTQTGKYQNRYDVTILVNGIPLIQIELKKRGTAIAEAFNQINRYSKESFNMQGSLFKYLQIFVVSNGTDTRYFANTTKRTQNNFNFTINWAKEDNSAINDIEDFTATFFAKNTLLNVLINYCILDTNHNLLIMRPYQIAATERILLKINSSYNSKNFSKPTSGGYIWHTTGSGKTLTSFKTAQLATQLNFIDKVFFVVDRKDLDYQTIKEYQKFSPNSVNGSNSTAELKANINKNDNKIIVTTIQKLNNLIKSEKNSDIYNKQVVFIFDECHRSQFGEAQRNIKHTFKYFYQFGFTGTPIFKQNSLDGLTTETIFGTQLHSYIITHAMQDQKVLKFKVDYNNVEPQFKDAENEQDINKLNSKQIQQAFLHPKRINTICTYILNNFNQKTHRLYNVNKGFNAMLAVSSVEAAKLYYQTFKNLQKDTAIENRLKIGTIFSYSANEEQNAIGDIEDEGFEIDTMHTSAKEFLQSVINDYNSEFKSTFTLDTKGFENYYKDLAKNVKDQKVDLIIVVGMFLTGFDAPTLNTLFVDKNLRYHGLIQAYSRTNRIVGDTKRFGNIVTFRNLEKATLEAITLFGNKNTQNILLEKSYKEYMHGFNDPETGKTTQGFISVVNQLTTSFPNSEDITTEKDKKEFVKLCSEYLRLENILQNYDEFYILQNFNKINSNNEHELQQFKEKYSLKPEDIEDIQSIPVINNRTLQDYKSTYNDIREWLHKEKETNQGNQLSINWDDVVFEVDLLKSQEINLDYILETVFNNCNNLTKDHLIEEAKRVIKSSFNHRAKEQLLTDFIKLTDLSKINNKNDLKEDFYTYAKKIKIQEEDELIESERLKTEEAKRYINNSLAQEYVSDNGTELISILPVMNRISLEYNTTKNRVFKKIKTFVNKFKGVGG